MAKKSNFKRPKRIHLSEQEVVRRMESFPKRREKFIAAIRKGKRRNLFA